MENQKEEKIYSGSVKNIKVEGKTYKEFTLNYLKAIIETYKDLPDTKRLKAYIEYFVDNFSYDKKMYNEKHDKNNKKDPTKEDKERELFELFYKNKGVCEQFSTGFALLCKLDEEINDFFQLYVAECLIRRNKTIDGHALNILNSQNGLLLIDISAMIHCKEKDNVGTIWDYGVVTIDNYIKNQKRNNIKFISNGTDGGIYLLPFRNNRQNNVGDYYEFLTQPAEVLNTKLKKEWFNIDITSFCEECSVS